MGVVNWGIYFGYGLSYIVGTYIPPLDIGGLVGVASFCLIKAPTKSGSVPSRVNWVPSAWARPICFL